MATYRLGSSGEEVRQIQARLQAPGLYRGPIDGAFGGGTEAAVKAFQQNAGLEVDGAVGPITWNALFNAGIPAPSLFSRPFDYRCLALMFDIKVQNGSIGSLVKAQILADFAGLAPDLPRGALEVEKMEIIARRRAEAANPRWVEDVRARKLCIAKGEGMVHGVRYNLEEQFGIGLIEKEE